MKTTHTQPDSAQPQNQQSSSPHDPNVETDGSPPPHEEHLSQLSEQLIGYLEDMEPTVTTEEAEESLRNLLTHRWDELELDGLGLDLLRQEILEDQPNRSGQMQVEYTPPIRSARSRRRLVSGILTVAAAAILFAYGPNLIESNIGEQEPQFPTVNQQANSSKYRHITPLAQREGKVLTPDSQSPRITLSKLVVGQMSDHNSSHVTYHLTLSNLKDTNTHGVKEIAVDLWRKQVNSQQQTGLKTQLKRASKKGEVKVISEQGQAVHVRHYQVPDSNLVIAEYLIKDQHFQWSAPIQGDNQVLMTLVQQHLKEVAQ